MPTNDGDKPRTSEPSVDVANADTNNPPSPIEQKVPKSNLDETVLPQDERGDSLLSSPRGENTRRRRSRGRSLGVRTDTGSTAGKSGTTLSVSRGDRAPQEVGVRERKTRLLPSASPSSQGGSQQSSEDMVLAPKGPIVPDCVPEGVWDHVQAFKPPTGFKPRVVGTKATAPYWFTGVRCYELDEEGTETEREFWFCLASESCRDQQSHFAFSGSTSNWSDHLRDVHSIESTRALKMASAKGVQHEERVRESKTANLNQTAQDRCD